MSYFAQNGIRTDVPQDDPPSWWESFKNLIGYGDEEENQRLSFPKPARDTKDDIKTYPVLLKGDKEKLQAEADKAFEEKQKEEALIKRLKENNIFHPIYNRMGQIGGDDDGQASEEMLNYEKGDSSGVRAIKEPIAQETPTASEAPADSGGFSTDALIAGLASVESSTNVTNSDELASEFEKKKDLRSELGSSAVGPLQYITSNFPDYDKYPNQLAFERARIEKGVSGERDLKSWGQDQFDRYSRELGPEKLAELEDALGHKLSPADFIWGAHLGGFQWPREIMGAYRDGKIDAQGVINSKPTPNNATFGQYTSGAYEAASKFENPEMKSEGGMMRVTKEPTPTGEGEPTEPEKDYYSSVEAKLQEMTGKPLEGLQNIQGFDWQKADELSSEELGVLNDLVTSVGGGTKGDSGKAISNAREVLPEIKARLAELEGKGIIDTPVAIDSILDEKGVTGIKRWGIEQALKIAGIL